MRFAASAVDYAASPSGYVVSVLLAILIGMVAYWARRSDKRTDEIEEIIAKHQQSIDHLDKTIGILQETVKNLNSAINRLDNRRR